MSTAATVNPDVYAWSVAERIQRIVAYEQAHDVHEYVAHGWHVWPLVRQFVTYRIFEQIYPPGAEAQPKTFVQRKMEWVKGQAQFAKSILHARLYDWKHHVRADAPGAHVVMWTDSSRRQWMQDAWIHYIVDPVHDLIHTRGYNARVWEVGDPRGPRHRPSSWVVPRLQLELKLDARRRGSLPPLQQPAWFADVAAWTRSEFGLDIQWSDVHKDINRVTRSADVFERWLKKAGTRVVFIDPWYSLHSMALALAASRLGIFSVELQHGVQGAGHPSYSSWTRFPDQGYEVRPDAFWFWGDDHLQDFAMTNAHQARLLNGGNVWLNRWRVGEDAYLAGEIEKARHLTRGYSKALLVTAQPVGDLDLILEVIRNSPADWCWLFRLHRSMGPRKEEYLNKLQELGRPGLIVDEATRLPLYAMFQAADVHLTRSSTCALEALAFGIPTVLFHSEGQECFGRYVDGQVMVLGTTCDEVLAGIEHVQEVPPELCQAYGSALFATEDATERALDEVLAHVGA